MSKSDDDKIYGVGIEIEVLMDKTTYYFNGKPHRKDGPAILIWNGNKEYYINGKRHREGGLPAIININGELEYWFYGEKITEYQAKNIHKLKNKRIKRFLRIWYDITYQDGKPAYIDSINRNMKELEIILGYNLS